MKDTPLVSVVMPVYNTSKYVNQAIESILHQTYTNFEFVIIDDASTDNSVEIIQSFSDTRIHLIVNAKNEGISHTRNKGMAHAKGKYIAVFDSDDIAFPYRLEKQVEFMEAHKACGLLGGQLELIDEKGNRKGMARYTEDSTKIPIVLFFKNHLAQPAAMIRQAALPPVWYKPEFIVAGDYELWVRMSRNGRVSNLPVKLVQYRVHADNITNRQSAEAHIYLKKILADQLDYLNMTYSAADFEVLYAMTNHHLIIPDESFMSKYIQLTDQLKTANQHKKVYDVVQFDKFIEEKKKTAARYFLDKKYIGTKEYHLDLLKHYLKLPFKYRRYAPVWTICKFAFKCFISYRAPKQ